MTKFFELYQKAMGEKPENIDDSVIARVPILIRKDNRYFQNYYQGIPIGGDKKMIENILKHPNIEIKTNTSFKD